MKTKITILMTLLLVSGCGTYDDALNDLPILDANTEAGKDVYATYNCAGCHGNDGRTEALGVSRIIVDIDTERDIQNALYTLQSVTSDRDTRMKGIAQQLSSQEIIDVAAYVASLK